MANFEKIDRVNINLDRKDINSYNMSSGPYSAGLTMDTTDGKTIEIRFDHKDDLISFIENVLDCALHMDWDLNYPSHYRKAIEDARRLPDVIRVLRPEDEQV